MNDRILALVCLLALLSVTVGQDPLDPGCDRHITMSTWNYTFPAQNANVTCKWIFSSDSTSRGYFAFYRFNLEDGERLVVYDGGVNASHVTANVTGKREPFLVATLSKETTVIFTSGPKASNSSEKELFFLNYTTEGCDLYVNESSAVIEAPQYLPNPSGMLNCTYHLSSSEGERLVLTFDLVNITKGAMEVWDGDTETGAPILSVDASRHAVTRLSDVLSTGPNLVLKAELATSKNENFNANFLSTNPVCPNGSVTLTNPGNVDSPGYPDHYINSLDCRWLVTAPEGAVIAVNVSDLDLGDLVDDVLLNDGDSKFSPLMTSLTSGYRQAGPLVTSSNKLWIRMRTDETRTGRGFRLQLTPQMYGGTGRNSGRIQLHPQKANETITSNITSDIYYQLYASEGMQVQLTMNKSLMFPGSSIEIRDGPSPSGKLLASFISDKPFYPVVSTGNNMLVVGKGFLINGSLSAQFFIADFTSVTPGRQYSLSGDSGSVTLHRSDLNESATWILLSPSSDRLISLTVHVLDLPANASSSIYLGTTDTATQFVKYSSAAGGLTPPKMMPVIYMPQGRIHYEMSDTDTVPASQVLLSFSYRIIPVCKRHELSKEYGDSVTSPLYPDLYPANARCTFTFTPAKNKFLRLAFSSVSLASTHTLTVEADHAHVSQNSSIPPNVTTEVLTILSGKHADLPDIIVNMNNNTINTTKVKLTFDATLKDNSSDLRVSQGFKINYEHLKCGGNNTGPVASPGYPDPVKSTSVRCLWLIDLPPHPATDNTSVNIISFQVDIKHYVPNTNTSETTIEIRDGGSERSEMIPLTMKDGQTGEMLSLTNRLWVLYNYNSTNQSKGTGVAFRLTFKTHECAKKDQCDNGRCMHNDWRCNGKDECGDDSDERDCLHATNMVSRLVLGLSIVVTFVLATVLACVVPALYKRMKYSNYSELRDLMTPVPT